ncbi:TPA: helix-turn-helix domain-containing protein [Pseudomonas aeruginosa]|nr:helix-turn-helix domain-containing protein [Pseudomonas aeruginosa]
MRIYILTLDGVFDLGLSALMDVIGTAAELNQNPSVHLDISLVSVRMQVHTGQGLSVPVTLVGDLPPPDLVLVPALAAKTPEALTMALGQEQVIEAGHWLAHWMDAGVRIGAACTGTLVLAEAGVLNGLRATTSWWLSAFFRQRYPQVELDESMMLINSEPVITAGAALAHFDLGLNVVSRLSPELATLCARYLLIDSRMSQATFMISQHIAHADPVVANFERWARNELAAGFNAAKAATALGVSQRTLVRKIQTALGKPPSAWFQDLRIEYAVHLLQTTSYSVDKIAEQVGYADSTTLRTSLRRKLGQGVRELRQRSLRMPGGA